MDNAERKIAAEKLAWLPTKSTDDLEADLSGLAAGIAAGAERLADSQSLFQSISAELKRRIDAKDERSAQPARLPLTKELAAALDADKSRDYNNQLTTKLIEMEAEQARLVVEAEVAKMGQRVAEEKLALVVKHLMQPQEKTEG